MKDRVEIHWDDLELAFTMEALETQSYLDLRTGNVELAANDLIGEEAGLSEEDVEAGFAAGYLIRIEPLSSREEYRWMVEFADTVRDPPVWPKCSQSRSTERQRFAGSKMFCTTRPRNESAGLSSTRNE